MAISKAKKGEIIAKLEDGLKTAETIAFVKFKGLTVKDTTEFRKQLRGAGVSYYVAKKTLMRRALDTKKYGGEMPELPGEIAIAWSKDPIAPAKKVFEFAKTHKDQVSLVGGVYESKYVSKDEIMVIATIPSREELLSKFAGMLNTSIANVVRAFDAKAKQMEGAPAA
jgi:large subunit ribosomal protein L10